MKRVVLVHGWDGVPDDAWKPWLKEQLEKKGWKWIAPQFPGGEHPTIDEWMTVLKETIPDPDKHTYFVGHSLGCPAILRYLATLPSDARIGGIVLVAGFCSSLSDAPEINSFTAQPFPFGEIKQRVMKTIVIGGRKDPAIPFGKVLELQAELGGELMLDDGKGHFGADDRITELPSVLKALEKCYQQRC
ncbi:serine hydrolase family protein [Candidatus Pacearchaeota archaeon]|nr:serine hydrolase family protein [Candidatus Pacearchaeota archaeon]